MGACLLICSDCFHWIELWACFVEGNSALKCTQFARFGVGTWMPSITCASRRVTLEMMVRSPILGRHVPDTLSIGSALFPRYPHLLGRRWVGPYCALSPTLAFVLEDDLGVCGYVLGALNTRDFSVGKKDRSSAKKVIFLACYKAIVQLCIGISVGN